MTPRWAGVALALTVLAGCVPAAAPTEPASATQTAEFGGTVLTTPYRLPEIELTDHHGRSFDLHTGSDAPVLVFYFGYTNCPDICLGVLTDLASAVNRLDEQIRAKVQVIFVTVDPARDTPEAMTAYLARIDPGFVGLTGEPAEIEKVAAAMGVGIEGIEKRPDGGYEVNHTAQVIAVNADREGVLVWTQGTSIGTYRADLDRLVRQQS